MGLLLATTAMPVAAADPGFIQAAVEAEAPKVAAWFEDFHANPELGNSETRTTGIVAAHLKGLGYKVREGVGVTGVVAVLRWGGRPGPVVALRADMDALPVTEANRAALCFEDDGSGTGSRSG